MLDYYGSIRMHNEDIDKDILQVFRKYQEKYIKSLLNKLRIQQILTTDNSISGYQIFIRGFLIETITHDIQKQTNKNNKKLLFTNYYLQKYKDNDVLQHIMSFYSTISDK